MANYSATARTNYFRVKNAAKFKKWVESIPDLRLLDEDGRKIGRAVHFGLYSDEGDTGCWPGYRFNDDEPLDIPLELSEHLKDGSVAIFMETGHEKLRYLHGSALAINSRGETKLVHLNQIYKIAKQLGPEVTEAEY